MLDLLEAPIAPAETRFPEQDPDTAKPPQNSDRKFLVLFATGSLEKIFQFNAIARLLGLPITFVNFKSVMDFHSTDEEKGNRLEHARDKNKELDIGVELLMKSPPHIEALKKLCAQYGIPYDPQNIFVASEDSSLSLIKKIWTKSRAVYARYIPSGIIRNAEKDTDQDEGGRNQYLGPGSELAPVLTAMGGVNNFIKAALTGRSEADELVRTLDASTMVVRRLDSSAIATEQDFTGKHFHHIIADVTAVVRNKLRWHDSTAQHLASAENPNKSFAEDIQDYFKNHSSRTNVIKALYKYLMASPYNAPEISPAQMNDAQALMTAHKSFVIRVMMGHAPALASFKNKVQGIIRPTTKATASLLQTLDLSANFTKDTDAYVYGAIGGKNLKQLRRAGYYFFSNLDERILEAESANKPVVLADDGSLTPLVNAYMYLVDTRVANDFDLLPEYERNFVSPLQSKKNIVGVGHKGFGLFDLLHLEDHSSPIHQARIDNATNDLLRHRRRDYKPSVSVPIDNIPQETNQKRRDDVFKVAVFTSASSDNRILLEQLRGICRGIGKLGDSGVVWGGGDRHAMGAVYDACIEFDIYHEGYSTPPILVAETKRGRMPKCSYSEISPHIFDRMAKMIESSDVITVTPGGFGTLQEMLAVLVLMDENPELMKNKSLIIHNSIIFDSEVPFWNPIIETFMGTDALTKMLANHRALAGQNIYMTTSVWEHDALIGDLKDKWEIDRKLKAVPPVKRNVVKQARRLRS